MVSGNPRKTPTAKERCHYCRCLLTKESRSKDHVVPLSRGGIDRGWNKVTSCLDCNQRKGSRWPSRHCPTCRDSIDRHAELGVTEEGPPETWVKPTRKGRTSYTGRAYDAIPASEIRDYR